MSHSVEDLLRELAELRSQIAAASSERATQRERERRLRADETRFRIMADTAPALLWMTGPEPGIKYVNRSWLEFRGRTLEQELGSGWRDGVHPEDIQRCDEVFQAAYRTRGEFQFEFRLRRRDGEYRWVEDRGAPSYLPDGTFLGYVGCSINITHRRQALTDVERQLRETKQLLTVFLEHLPIAGQVYDTRFRIIDWNPAAERIFGYTRSEAIGAFCPDLIVPPLEREAVASVFAALLERRGGETHTNDNITKGGRTIRCRWHNAPLIGNEGEVIGVMSMAEDITERARAEELRRESEQQLRQVIDLVPHMIFAKDRDGRFLLANQAVADAYGMTLEALMKSAHRELHAPGPEIDRMLADDREVIDRGCSKFIPLETFTDSNGQLRSLQTVKIPFQRAGTNEPAVLGFALDITDLTRAEAERARLEGQLQQTQRLESLGVLTGGIAHDFNNLLMIMLGHVNVAQSRLPESAEEARESIAEIGIAARQAAALCDQMLAFSGRSQPKPEVVDLRELVGEMVHLLQVSAPKSVSVEYQPPDTARRVEVDPTQVRQILLNLITNGIEAIGDGPGRISLTTEVERCDRALLESTYLAEELPEGDYVCVEVRDDGAGMGQETLGRLFEPFFTTKFTGRGLGLAAVLGIVRGHRGALSVSSTVGSGTTFRIFLPEATGVATCRRAELDAEDDDWRGEGLVLLVDDERMVRAVVKKMLENIGFEVIVAEGGDEAIRIYRERGAEIDLVMLDLIMPERSGEETYQELRVIDPAVRVVVLSGYEERDAVDEYDFEGIAAYLHKPCEVGLLRRALRRALTP